MELRFLKTSQLRDSLVPEVAGSVWKEIVRIADKYNQRGNFTTFVAYGSSSTPDNRNLHRNVIFKDFDPRSRAAFSSIVFATSRSLWAWMDAQRKQGNELLCISHNANLSDGIMFPIEVDNKGRPIDAAWGVLSAVYGGAVHPSEGAPRDGGTGIPVTSVLRLNPLRPKSSRNRLHLLRRGRRTAERFSGSMQNFRPVTSPGHQNFHDHELPGL